MEMEPEEDPQLKQVLGGQENSEKIAPLTRDKPQLKGKNVSFATAVTKVPTNSHSIRQGNIRNPYKPASHSVSQQVEQGTLYHQRSPQTSARIDKIVTLKKNNTREHIHRYTLRFKMIASKSEEENHQVIIDTLQRFLAIVLQAEPKTILPPYLDLDRNDKSVQDISSAFPVASIDSIHVLKKYFFRLSSRDEAGLNWCSIILAQSVPFSIFIEKARYSLENSDLAFGLRLLTT